MYRNTPHSATQETPTQLILGRSTRLQFGSLIPNTNEVVIEQTISQINNGDDRSVSLNIADNVLARDYRNNNNKWQKVKLSNAFLTTRTHNVDLDDWSIWT